MLPKVVGPGAKTHQSPCSASTHFAAEAAAAENYKRMQIKFCEFVPFKLGENHYRIEENYVIENTILLADKRKYLY